MNCFLRSKRNRMLPMHHAVTHNNATFYYYQIICIAVWCTSPIEIALLPDWRSVRFGKCALLLKLKRVNIRQFPSLERKFGVWHS